MIVMPKENMDIGAIHAQTEQNTKDILGLRGEMREGFNSIIDKLDRVATEARKATTPNYGNIWAAAAVFLAIVVTIGNLASSNIKESIQVNRSDVIDLKKWNDDRIKSDLEELHQRRMSDAGKYHVQ